MDERERLRDLEHRVEYTEAMARQLREQAEMIAGSLTWRLRVGATDFARKLAGKARTARACAGIPSEKYWRWIADCERRELGVPEHGPRFCILTTDERTMASLRAQTYSNWEVGETGDYIVRPAPGAEFSPDALALFAEAARNDAALVYCDEDALDARGLRIKPWFKPDWSPDLMAARDYIGQAFAVRRELATCPIEETGNGGGAIVHVPRVLYHRRGGGLGTARRMRYPVPPGSRVEIVIPSRNAGLLARCLEKLRKTGYPDYGIAIVDNSGGDGIAALAARYGARHVDWRGRALNYSAMNNAAVVGSAAPLLLFLNDDTTAVDAGWLEAMVEQGARPEVGVVGARLLYPDGSIQHAGVVIGIFGVCGHAFKHCPASGPTYGGLAETVRNVSAVTGACMLARAEVFREVGGFDEKLFPVAYNDIDFCLRVLATGRRVVYTPAATLHHHEAFSRPWSQREPARAEVRAFQERWRRYIEHDPFYNPNLTRIGEDYALRNRGEWT